MTRPIVDRVVRNRSETALRRAIRLAGDRPSTTLAATTSRGMTIRAPTSSPVPVAAAPRKARRNPATLPPSATTAAATRVSAPPPMRTSETTTRHVRTRALDGCGGLGGREGLGR